MGIQSTVLILSSLAVIATFWGAFVKADKADGKRWKMTIATALVSLVLNTGIEGVKYVLQMRQANAAARAESERRAINGQLLEELQGISGQVNQVLDKLNDSPNKIPVPTAFQLRREANKLQEQLALVGRAVETNSAPGSNYAEIASMIKALQINAQRLNASITEEMDRNATAAGTPSIDARRPKMVEDMPSRSLGQTAGNETLVINGGRGNALGAAHPTILALPQAVHDEPGADSARCEVKILEPLDHAVVGEEGDVSGTANIPPRTFLIVFAFADANMW
jgi:hypothetical protein